ncbi:MAG: hypothetical protein WD627_09790 [Actinomycetota bacterium]
MTVTESHVRRGRRAPFPGGRAPLSVPGPAAATSRKATPAASRRSKRSDSILVLVALLVAGGVVFGLVLVNIALAQSSFQLADLQKRSAEGQVRQRQLRFEVAKAESPERIAQMGADLGLVAPERQEYLQGPAVLVASHSEPAAGTAGFELAPARP